MEDFLAEARKWVQRAGGAPTAPAPQPLAQAPAPPAAPDAAPPMAPAYEAALEAGKLFEQVAALTASLTAERDRADAAEARCIALEQALERHAAEGRHMEAQLASLGGAVRDELAHMAADLEASQARVNALQALLGEREAEVAKLKGAVADAEERVAGAKADAEAAAADAGATKARAEAAAAEGVAAAQVAAATAERAAAEAAVAKKALAARLEETEAALAALAEQNAMWKAENERVRADNDRLRQEVHLAAAAAAVATTVAPAVASPVRDATAQASAAVAAAEHPSPSPRGRSTSRTPGASGSPTREPSASSPRPPWRLASGAGSLSRPASGPPTRAHTPSGARNSPRTRDSGVAPEQHPGPLVPDATGFAASGALLSGSGGVVTSTDVAKVLYGRPGSPGRMAAPSEGGWGHRGGGSFPAPTVAAVTAAAPAPTQPPPAQPALLDQREAAMLAQLAAAKAREQGLLEALAERDQTMAALVEGIAGVKAAGAAPVAPPPPRLPSIPQRQVFFEVTPTQAAPVPGGGADVDALPSAGLVRVIDRGSHRIYKAHAVGAGAASAGGSRPALGWAAAAAEAVRRGALPSALVAVGGTPAAAAAALEAVCSTVVHGLLEGDATSLSISLLDVRGETVRDVLALRRAKPTDADAAPLAHRSGSGVAYAAPLLLTKAAENGSSGTSSACPALDDATRVAVARPEEALVVIRTGLHNRGLLYPEGSGWEGGAGTAGAVYGPHRGHAVLALHVATPSGGDATFFVVCLGLPGWVASTALRAAAESAASLSTLPPASLAVQLQLDAAGASQGIQALGGALEALAQLSVAAGEGGASATEIEGLRAGLAACVSEAALTRVLAPALHAGSSASAAPAQALLVPLSAHMPYATDADAVAFLLMGNDVTQRQLIPPEALPPAEEGEGATPSTVDLSQPPAAGGLMLPSPLVSPRVAGGASSAVRGALGSSGYYVPNPATVAGLQAQAAQQAAAAAAFTVPSVQTYATHHHQQQQQQQPMPVVYAPHTPSSSGRGRPTVTTETRSRYRSGSRGRRPSGGDEAGSATAFNPPSPVFSSVSQQARRLSLGSAASTAFDVASLLDGQVLRTSGGPLAVNSALPRARELARARSASKEAAAAQVRRGRAERAASGTTPAAAARSASGSGRASRRPASPPSPSFPVKSETKPLRSQFISVEAYLARGGPASASASIVSVDTLKRAAAAATTAAGADGSAPAAAPATTVHRARSHSGGADSLVSMGSSASAELLRSMRASAHHRLPPHAEEGGRGGDSSTVEDVCPESPPVSPAALGIRIPWEEAADASSMYRASGTLPPPMSLQPPAEGGDKRAARGSSAGRAGRARLSSASSVGSSSRASWLQGGVIADSLTRLNAFVGSVAEEERRRVAAARAAATQAAAPPQQHAATSFAKAAGRTGLKLAATVPPPVAATPAPGFDDLDAAIAAELRVQQQLAAADAALAAVASSAASRAAGATAFAASLSTASQAAAAKAAPAPAPAPAPQSFPPSEAAATVTTSASGSSSGAGALQPPPLPGDPVPGMRRLLHALDSVTGPLTGAVFKQLLEVLGAGDVGGAGFLSEPAFSHCLHRFLPELTTAQIDALVVAMHMKGLPLIDYRDFVQALAALASGDGLLLGH